MDLSDNRVTIANVLIAQGRWEEAEAMLIEAIGAGSDDAGTFCQLSLCQQNIDGKNKQALESIERAISIEPSPYHLAVKGLALARLDKYQKAIVCAEQALALEPDDPFHFYVRAVGNSGLARWEACENDCRKALELDPDDSLAKNLLAIALRMQGKRWETEVAVGQLLEEDPEDAWAHCNAGWAALTNSDQKKAEQHFRESLRLDPHDSHAREGLLESFKARSPLYRAYLKYVFWMARFEKGTRWAIIIGAYLIFRVGRVILAAIHPLLAVVFVFAYLVFVFGGWLASGVGNLLILADRSARYALGRREILEAIFVGAGFFGGFVLVLAGLGTGLIPLAFVGGALLVAAIPWSLTFTNDSPSGQKLFGAIGLFVYVAGVWSAVEWGTHADLSEATQSLLGLAVLAALLCTFIGNLDSLHK